MADAIIEQLQDLATIAHGKTMSHGSAICLVCFLVAVLQNETDIVLQNFKKIILLHVILYPTDTKLGITASHPLAKFKNTRKFWQIYQLPLILLCVRVAVGHTRCKVPLSSISLLATWYRIMLCVNTGIPICSFCFLCAVWRPFHGLSVWMRTANRELMGSPQLVQQFHKGARESRQTLHWMYFVLAFIASGDGGLKHNGYWVFLEWVFLEWT